MAFDARVLQFFVASPSDVPKERAIVREVLAEWNDLHSQERKIVLLPIMWETHSAPELGGRAQGMINDRLLVNADALIGIFWGKLGSPTGVTESGTLEEIKEHHGRKRPVHLYFSKKMGAPADFAQHQQVEEAENWAHTQGITERVTSTEDFRKKLTRQLPLMLRSPYIRELLAVHESAPANEPEPEPRRRPSSDLSPMAEHYLRKAAGTENKILNLRETRDRVEIIFDVRTRLFNGPNNAEAAQHKAALGELAERGFAGISQGARDETHFGISKRGQAWVFAHPE